MTDESIVRKSFPTSHADYTIIVTSERFRDGTWAVVTNVKQANPHGERMIDLPVPDQTFATQDDAEDFGLRMGMDWLKRNAPRTAA
jgi:hypothetical protein